MWYFNRGLSEAHRNVMAMGAMQFNPATDPKYAAHKKPSGGLGYFGAHQEHVIAKVVEALSEIVCAIFNDPAPVRIGKGLDTKFVAPALSAGTNKVHPFFRYICIHVCVNTFFAFGVQYKDFAFRIGYTHGVHLFPPKAARADHCISCGQHALGDDRLRLHCGHLSCGREACGLTAAAKCKACDDGRIALFASNALSMTALTAKLHANDAVEDDDDDEEGADGTDSTIDGNDDADDVLFAAQDGELDSIARLELSTTTFVLSVLESISTYTVLCIFFMWKRASPVARSEAQV